MRSRTLQSSKYVNKRRKKMIGLIIISIFCVGIIITALVSVLRISFLQIDTVMITGDNDLTPSLRKDIQEKSLSLLEGKYIYSIPRSNILFFPKDDIKKAVMNDFKEIESVKVRRGGLSSIILSLKSRSPVAIVCSGFHEEKATNENCFYTDAHAYVYAPLLVGSTTPTSQVNQYKRYYVPTDRAEIVTGVRFIDEGLFKDLQVFLDGAIKGGLLPLGVLIGDDGEYEMYTQGGTTVYFDAKTPLTTSLSNLLTFWQNDRNGGIKSMKATSTAPFDYINLHFGNTIYYSRQ